MKCTITNKIKYGTGFIQEVKDWLTKYKTGPVHWNVWDQNNNLIGKEVPANKLQNYMVQNNLLTLW